MSHVLVEALVEIEEICMAGGGLGGPGSLLSSRKATSANQKKTANNFRNQTTFVSLWTNQVSLTIIDVMLIGCQTTINCFVLER